MAYATKYYIDHYSNAGIRYYVRLQKDGYSGSASRLKLTKGGLTIDYDLKDWDETVMVMSSKLNILNDASNWYAYEDLFTLEDKEFKILIDASYNGQNVKLFDGWINSSPVVQKYLNNSVINITGSNFIQKMDKLSPPIINTQDASNGDTRSIIDLINGAVQLTGKIDPIYVNCTLEPSGGIIDSSTTLFNKCGLNPTIFMDDNANRESGLDMVADILTPFNSYLYWWNGAWYAERYADLCPSTGNKGYVKYTYATADVSYWYSDKGVYTPINEPSINLPISSIDSSVVFGGASQTISMIPGLEFLEISLDESECLNLTVNDFTGIQGGSFPSVHYPPYKKWNASRFTTPTTGTGWHFPGYTATLLLSTSTGYSFEESYNIKWTADSSAIGLYRTGPGKPYSGIQNSILRWGVPSRWAGGVFQENNKHYAGLSTRFKVSLYNEETKLNIKWKFLPISVGSGGPKAWDYKCYWTLRAPTGSYWIVYNEDSDIWEYKYSNTLADYVNTIEVTGPDLNEAGYADIAVDIPIGDVSGWVNTGDKDLIFSILGEDIRKTATTTWNTSNYVLFAGYGDVFITGQSGIDKANNKIIAQLNKNVLNSKKIQMKIYDTSSLMLDNGVQTASNFSTRTSLWKEHGKTTARSLVEWYIHDRYMLYNRNRREISGNIIYPGYLKPMSCWYDINDPSTRKYVLTGYTYKIDEDSYNCTWLEYDNNSVINITGAGQRPDTLVDPRSTRDRSAGTTTGTVRSVGDRTVPTSTSTTRTSRRI